MERSVIMHTYYAAYINNWMPGKYSTGHDGRIRLPIAMLSSEDVAVGSASFRLFADCSVLHTHTYNVFHSLHWEAHGSMFIVLIF